MALEPQFNKKDVVIWTQVSNAPYSPGPINYCIVVDQYSSTTEVFYTLDIKVSPLQADFLRVYSVPESELTLSNIDINGHLL